MPTLHRDCYIFFHPGKTGTTGRLIRDALSIRSQRTYNNFEPARKVIRWGNSYTQIDNGIDVLNNDKSLVMSTNKHSALEIMRNANVSVPFTTTNKEVAGFLIESQGYKFIGRTDNHQGGSGFVMLETKEDVMRDYQSSHWLKYQEIETEYRIHVFRDEILGVSKKISEGVEDRISNKFARNHENGWRLSLCRTEWIDDGAKNIAKQAVKSLGLDFGAVDIILSEGKYFVLEVNSAASLEPESTIFGKYIEKFKEWIE